MCREHLRARTMATWDNVDYSLDGTDDAANRTTPETLHRCENKVQYYEKLERLKKHTVDRTAGSSSCPTQSAVPTLMAGSVQPYEVEEMSM